MKTTEESKKEKSKVDFKALKESRKAHNKSFKKEIIKK